MSAKVMQVITIAALFAFGVAGGAPIFFGAQAEAQTATKSKAKAKTKCRKGIFVGRIGKCVFTVNKWRSCSPSPPCEEDNDGGCYCPPENGDRAKKGVGR